MTVALDQADWADFLRAGGVLGLREWLGLEEETRLALAKAGQAVWAERVLAALDALGSPEGLARLHVPLDGGERLLTVLEGQALAALERTLRETGS